MAVLACAAAAAAAAAGAVPIAHADGEAVAVAAFNTDRIMVFHPASTLNFYFGATGTGDGQFNAPRAVDFHPYGIIAVADRVNHNVQVFYPNGTFAFKIGSTGGCGSGQLNQPSGVAVGPGGMIAVGNPGCHNVPVFHPNGTHAFTIGTGSSGGGSGQLDDLRGVDFGPGGMIAVADRRNERVQVFHPNGTLALGFGTRGSNDGQFRNPLDVAFLAGGGFAVVDTGRHDVQIFDSSGNYASKIGSTGIPGSSNGQFRAPEGIAAGPGGTIAVADTGHNNRIGRIQVFDSGHAHAYTIASGSGNAEFDYSQGVAFGPADAHNAAVLVSGVSSPDGVYLGGSEINITVRFTAPVEVEGQPRLALSTWPPRNATLADGNGTDALVFQYAVQEGDMAADLDYMGMASLLLEGGLGDIRPASGAAGTASPVLPHPGSAGSLGASSDVMIVPRARVTGVTTPDADATYGAGQEIRIRIAFNEAVDVRGTPLLHLTTDPPRAAAYVDGSDGDAELEFLYTVRPGETTLRLAYNGTGALSLPPGAAIVDSAGGHDVLLDLPEPGSEGSLSHSSLITIDSSAPAGPGGTRPPAPVILTASAAVSATPQEIVGVATPGSTVTVYNNALESATAQAHGTTGWWNASVGLSEGSNMITATATLPGGTSASPSSAAVNITLDTMPPPVPVILNEDGEAAPSRMHVIRGTAEPGSLVEIYVDGALARSTSAHYEYGHWHGQVLLAPSGSTVTVRAIDGLGNPSGHASLAVTAPSGPLPQQMLDVRPHVVGQIDDDDGVAFLNSPRGVKAFEHDGRAYALVASAGSSAVQVIDFTDPRDPMAVHAIRGDGVSLGQPRDIELFTISGTMYAAIVSHRGGDVKLIAMSDPLAPMLVGTASHRVTFPDNDTLKFPHLIGANDAAVFNATVDGMQKTLLIVVSDYGPTDLDPGAFTIIDVTNPRNPIPISANHAAVRDGLGQHALARPPSSVPWLSSASALTSRYALNLADPTIVAVFDGDGDPVALNASISLPERFGYDQSFVVPTEALYRPQHQTGGPWHLSVGTIIEVTNSSGDRLSFQWLNGSVAPFFAPEQCPDDDSGLHDITGLLIPGSFGRGTVPAAGDGDPGMQDPGSPTCAAQTRIIVVHNNDTPDNKLDDYVVGAYKDALRGSHSYPVAWLIGGKMLSVGQDRQPFSLGGIDSANRTFDALGGASSVDVFSAGGGTYAVVAAPDSDGVQVINMTDPRSPSVASAARNGQGAFDRLAGARGVAAATLGGVAHAVAASEDGVQIVSLADPAAPAVAASIADMQGTARGAYSMLGGGAAVDIFEHNSRTYAMVAAPDDGGFQIIDITDPASPAPADRGHDGSRCSTAARYSALDGAAASDTLYFGGRLYAVVAAEFDDGIQVVDITNPNRLVALGTAFDQRGGFSELHDPISVEAVEIDGRAYILVVSFQADDGGGYGSWVPAGRYPQPAGGGGYGRGGGVQIIEVSDPYSPVATAALQHSDHGSGFKLLEGVRRIDTFKIGTRTYAIITSETPRDWSLNPLADSGAFTIADITNPAQPKFVSGKIDGQRDANGRVFDMLNAPTGVETAVIDGRTYAVIAARGPWNEQDHGVQIVDVSVPASPLAVASIKDGGTDGHGGTYNTLSRAHGVDIVRAGQGWYALVASIWDDGVQVINITDPSSPTAVSDIDDADPNTMLDGARNIKAFTSGGSAYAIVTASADNAIQILNITAMLGPDDPDNPAAIDSAMDHSGRKRDNHDFTELIHSYDVSLFTMGGTQHAASTCDAHGCNGVQIINMGDPADITAPTEIWERARGGNNKDANALLGPRGIATFEIDGSVYAAVAGYDADAVQMLRLVGASETTAPVVVRAELNAERGMLYLTFSERVKDRTFSDAVAVPATDAVLGLITVRNQTGTQSVALSGAQLGDRQGSMHAQQGIRTVEIVLSDSDAALVRGIASPVVDLGAGAFKDLSDNPLGLTMSMPVEIVTSRPSLRGASLDLGSGELVITFTEDVDQSTVDLSRIAAYSADDPLARYVPNERILLEADSPDLVLRLGEGARQAMIALAGEPLVDVLDGAVNSSETGRPSEERRGIVVDPIIDDRVDPVLLSARLDGRLLTLTFTEHVNVNASVFRLDRMHLRDGITGGAEFSLAGADILSTANATHVLVRLTETQAAAAASYADPVLDLRLDGPFGAVQDLSGQGIGAATAAVSRAGDGSGFSARATAPDMIRVSFGTAVTASATDPGATWILGGPDAGDLAVSEYGAVRGAASVVLGLSGNLSSTRPDLTLEYVQGVGDIVSTGGGAAIGGAVVRVSDGIAPRIESARITDGLHATIRYSERVSAPHAAYDSADVLGGEVGRPSTLASGNGTEAHVITLGQFVGATNATGTAVINANMVADEDGNALGAGPVQRRQTLEDGRPPEVASAEITGGNTLAVMYSEPVTATREAYAAIGIAIGDTVRTAASLDGTGTDLHMVTFGGDPVPPGTGAGSVTINGTLVRDLAEPPANRLGAGNLTAETTDGRPVAILSARVTGPGVVTVLYDDHGVAPQRYTSLVIDDRSRDLVPQPESEGAVEVRFTPEDVMPNSTGRIGISGKVHMVGDGQAPSVAGATAVSRTEIRVAFDEPVNATDASGAAGGWEVSGTDSGGSTVESRRGISPPSAELVLTLGGGGLASDRPLGVVLGYDGATGALITDPAGNRLPGGSVAVSDGIAPMMAWAGITGGNEATIRYSENVSAPDSAYERVEVPEGSDDRASSIKSGNGTKTHVILFGSDYVAATNATGIVVLGAALAVDDSGNAADPGTYHLRDGRPPEVASVNVTAGDTLTVNYTEPVLALAGAYTDLVIDNVPRAIVGSPAGNGTDSHEITFSGNAARPGADGTLSINNALVLDRAMPQPYPLAGELERLRIPHGHVPLLYSAKITGNGTATVEYSKGVWAPQSAYDDLDVYGSSRVIQAPFDGNGSRTHTIQFTPADAPPNATGSVSIDLSAVVDSAGTPVGSATATRNLADGQPPSVSNAMAVSLNAILVRFSEPVNATGIGGAGGWSVGGGDASDLAVLSASDISGGHDRLTLTLDGNFSSTGPTGVEVSYDTTGGLVTDAGGNVLSAEPTPVADGIAPGIERAAITGRDNATIWYTEPVSSQYGPYLSLELRPGGQGTPTGDNAGSLSDTHTVWFGIGGGGGAAANATGTMVISAPDILDAAGNPLGMAAVDQDLADGQRPGVLSAAVRNATSVLVVYNEPVAAPVRAYTGLSLGDAMSRTFAGLEGNLTAGHVAVFEGAPAPEDSMGTLTINETAVFDLADPPNRLGDDASRDLALGDDARPPVRLSASVTEHKTITVRYSRAVTAPESAYANVTVGGVPRSMSSLDGNGSAVHKITFAPGDAPPNATGSMLVNETAVRSMGGGPLGAGPAPANWTLMDGQRPSIVRAEAVVLPGGTRDTIRVVFDEPVADGSAGDYGADGWSAAGGDMGTLAVSSRHALDAGSAEIVLRLDGDLPDDSPSGILLAYNAAGDDDPVVDESGNPLGSVSSRAVDDGIAPNLLSANITADRTVVVSYSELVEALPGAYAEILLGNGTAVGIAGVVDSGTAEHRVALDGTAAPIPRGMPAKIVVNASAVLDAAARPNSLGDGNKTSDLSEGRATTVVSSSVTGPDTLAVRFDAAAAAFEHETLFVEGAVRSVAEHTGGGTAEHMILFEPANASSSATGWFTIDPRAVFVGPENLTLSDGQAPGIESATAESLSTMRVLFDEAVTDAGTGGWQVSGDDTGSGLAVSSSRVLPPDRQVLELVLDGQLRDTLPDEVVLSYDGSSGSVADDAGNDLGPVGPMPVGDGITPAVLSATAYSRTGIGVVFSEPVNATGTDGAGWSVSGVDAAGLAVISSSDISDPSDALNLTLDGSGLPDTAPDAVISYDTGASDVADQSGNALGRVDGHGIDDGIAPKVRSASIIGPRLISVSYSEPVTAAGPSAYAGAEINGEGAARDVALSPASNRTILHAITLDGPAAAANATGTLAMNQTMLIDAAGNALGSNASFVQALSDGQRPKVRSALIAADNAVTISYTEPVRAPPSAYANLTIAPGGARNITALADNDTAMHVITFDGGAARQGANGTIAIDATAVLDMADPPNALGGSASLARNIFDGRILQIISAKVTGPDTATVQYSRPALAKASDYAPLVVGGQGRTIDNLDIDADAAVHTLTFSGGDPAESSATGYVVINASAVMDPNDIALGAGEINQTLADGQLPSVQSAAAVSLTAIRVEFDEPVSAATADGAGWSVSGGDAAGLGVAASSDISAGSAELVLSLGGGGLPDTAPDDVVLLYDPDGGSVADAAGNDLDTVSRLVGDGIAPAVQSALAVSLTEIRVELSEPVRATGTDGAGWSVSGGDAAGLGVAASSDISAAASRTLNLTLGGGGLPDTAPDGVALLYDPGAGDVADQAGNDLGSASRPVGDGIAPAIASARITGPFNITIEYSEPVVAGRSAYAGAEINGEGAARGLGTNLSAATNGTIVHELAIGADAAANATGTLAIDQTMLIDAAGNALGSNASFAQALSDGQRPQIKSALITGDNAVTISYTEPVRAPPAAYSNLTLDPGGPRSVTGVADNDTARHAIAFGGGPAELGASGTIAINRAAVLDMAEPPNALGGNATLAQAILDGRSLQIVSAKVSGRDTATVQYSRPATAQMSDYASLVVGGQGRTIAGLDVGSGDTVHTLTFSGGDPAAPNATGSVVINASAVRGLDAMPLGSGAINRTLADGQDPSMIGAEAVSRTEIRAVFDEPVSAATADGAGWSVSGGDAAGLGVISGISAGSAELALSLGGGAGGLPDTAPDDVVLLYDPGAGGVADLAGNDLGSASRPVGDGIAPEIASARITGPFNITIEYSEPVVAGRSAYAGAEIDGGGDDSRNATRSSANGVAVHVLDMGGGEGEAAAAAANATGTLTMDQTMLADAAGNMLGSNASFAQALSDGQRPRVESALIAADNAVTISYTEPVRAPPSAYANLTLAPGGPRSVTGVADNDTARHAIAFDGGAARQGAGGAITVDAAAVLDMADPPNALGPGGSLVLTFSDGRDSGVMPGEANVVGAAFTARNTATITYSGMLGAPGGNASAAYGAITIEPADEGGNATIALPESVSGWGTETHAITFGGAGVGAGQNGSIELKADLEGRDGGGAPIRFSMGLIRIAAGETVRTVELPPPPPVAPPEPGSGQPGRQDPAPVPIVRDGFTRAVNGTAGGEAARPAINVTGLAARNGTVAFPGDGNVTLEASFARASFPPNTTALSAPDRGLIALRVSEKPDPRQVADALGYGNATVEVRTVVEVGDNRTDIEFTLPVRILLANQSGGDAFYVNSTGGRGVAPIGTACRGDGTETVHAQLGGAGECQIDSGGDKAIHTYHLTRFGTARVAADEPGERPRVDSVSALRRAGGDPLDAPASYSAGQTVVVGVRFTGPVSVDTAGGVPYLELVTGSAGARAPYSPGSGTDVLEFAYVVRGGDIAARLSYAGTGALVLNGSAIAAAGSGPSRAALVGLPEPGGPGSLSHASSAPVRIDPEPGRPVLQIGILDDEAGADGRIREAALMAAGLFNEQQGLTAGALIANATAYDAAAAPGAAAGAAPGPAALAALRAAHSSGAGPYAYVGPSTDRGLHAAMPYAAAGNIVLVSAGSRAPTLAVADDMVFRLLPSDRLEADALARLARSMGAESMHAVIENATHGPPLPAGSLEDPARVPPPQGMFSHGFGAALSYSAAPPLSGAVSLGGEAGSYAAGAAAAALDASVRSAGARAAADAAVVYLGSPQGLAALAESSAAYPALRSATWLASGPSAGSLLLEGDGPAAAFAAQAGLAAARWSPPPAAAAAAGAVDPLMPPGASEEARHRAYAAYDAVLVIGAAASSSVGARGDPPGAAAIAGALPGAAAEYSGAIGDIVLDYAGDLWVPAMYELWTAGESGRPGTAGAEWSRQPNPLDEERACSITLTRAKIDYGPIDSGQTSRPHLQTIVNTGQLPFAQVDLTATPWHVDSPGGCAPGDSPSLPVGLSEIRTDLGGDFSDLVAAGTTLARGLEAGGQAPLWYRLSLVGYADLPQAQITQCATYVVRCS